MRLKNGAIQQADQLKDHNHQVAEAENASGSIASEHSLEDQALYQGFQPSSFPTRKDVAESRRVGKAVRAQRKRCWFNARNAILKLKDYAEASYCEGWVRFSGGNCEHGWIVKDGVIIDPTLPDQEVIYFPGLEFVGRAGIAEFLATPQGRRQRHYPFFCAFGWHGKHSASYMRAFAQLLELIAKRKKTERRAKSLGQEKTRK